MHQHPRPPPSMASPASSEQTNPIRSNNQRDRTPSTQASGSSEDFVASREPDNSASMQRLNQVIQNFHTKAALIILHSRADLSPAYSSKTNEIRVNKWFNIELDETDDYLDDIKRWKRIDVQQERPPPLIIEIYLTTDALPQGQRLVILDEDQKRWDVYNALEPRQSRATTRAEKRREILLERWTIELGDPTQVIPADLGAVLPHVYKKSIVLFRALYTYCNFLPAWKLLRKLGKGRSTMGMKIGFRIVDGDRLDSIPRADNLTTPLYDTSSPVIADYSFGSTDSPAGPFSVNVKYRSNCDFRIDDSEELLSSRFMVDQDTFSSRDDNKHQIGSLPTDQRKSLMQRPELGHAYGSLSTYHQAGIEPGTSPMSALRAQKDYGTESPRPSRPLPQPTQSQRPSIQQSSTARRSSFSIQPFKTPTLAASPLASSPLSASPRVASSRAVPTLGSLEEEASTATAVTSNLRAPSTENVSTSGSPKPVPVQRFQSSFGHRKNRLSVDRPLPKPDDDQTSSGKASATSSAQPGSGLMVDLTGDGSSGSMQADDENISDFLKMLDQKKDLLSPSSGSAVETSARRTAAALNKFHKMRDSNAALSESMSSSLIVAKSPASPGRSAAAISSSSSPGGKPMSPHAPHTPFAPSRLSAAYSHDDPEMQESQSPTQERLAPVMIDTPGAIAIPNSPRPFIPGYRRSSSAQRQRLTSDEDVNEPYGLRSASMGAKISSEPSFVEEPTVLGSTAHGTRIASSARTAAAGHDGTTSDSGSGRSSVAYARRTRYELPSSARGGPQPSTPQGSISSISVTGTSVEKDRAIDSGNTTGWNRGSGRTQKHASRPQSKIGGDDDDDLPFLFPMDASTIQGPDKK